MTQTPPEAYGRVTDPGRFGVVVDVADALLGELLRTFDVVVAVAPLSGWGEKRPIERAARVQSPDGRGLDVAVTDFPGIFLRVDGGDVTGFPACGCDACDDDLEDLVEGLRLSVRRAAVDLGWQLTS